MFIKYFQSSLVYVAPLQLPLPAFGKYLLRFSTSTATSNIDKFRLENFNFPVPQDIAPTIALSTANQKEITQVKIREAIQKYKLHEADSGSTPVQSRNN